jgi:hypothetical protein
VSNLCLKLTPQWKKTRSLEYWHLGVLFYFHNIPMFIKSLATFLKLAFLCVESCSFICRNYLNKLIIGIVCFFFTGMHVYAYYDFYVHMYVCMYIHFVIRWLIMDRCFAGISYFYNSLYIDVLNNKAFNFVNNSTQLKILF